jgi:hypothetical protein
MLFRDKIVLYFENNTSNTKSMGKINSFIVLKQMLQVMIAKLWKFKPVVRVSFIFQYF